MPSEALDALQAELTAAQATLKPIIEGLEDYNRLNILPETKQIVQVAMADAKKRMSYLDAAQKALSDLEGNNYPSLDTRLVTEAVYRDLAEQKSTIDAALGKFAPQAEAATATVVAGTPVPK